MSKKKPWLAALLNIILQGLGYIYIGKRRIFGALLILGSLLFYVWAFMSPIVHYLVPEPLLFISGIVWLAAFAIDAYREAKTT